MIEFNDIPKSAMVVFAHPDDAEIGSRTAAKWSDAGCKIFYVLATGIKWI